MEEHELSFNFRAHYYKSGVLNASTKQLWFVLHGYGQLAKYFIKKFDILTRYGICVIAPEGLSRFYLEDVSSRRARDTRVGATWMTKENRLTDIANYLDYLDTIYLKEVAACHPSVTLLGFSQGAATASRWACAGKVNFKKFILWAGLLPPDMSVSARQSVFKNKETKFVYGTRDPYLTDDRFLEMKILAEKISLTPEYITFEGGHDIDENTLLKLI